MRELPGINIQFPWSQLILSGKKTIETRFYPLPSKYIGKEMALIETPGARGKFKRRVVGLVTFGPSFKYRNASEFYMDSERHLVLRGRSDFAWKKGKAKWGWPIVRIKPISGDLPDWFRAGIIFSTRVPLSTQSSS